MLLIHASDICFWYMLWEHEVILAHRCYLSAHLLNVVRRWSFSLCTLQYWNRWQKTGLGESSRKLIQCWEKRIAVFTYCCKVMNLPLAHSLRHQNRSVLSKHKVHISGESALNRQCYRSICPGVLGSNYAGQELLWVWYFRSFSLLVISSDRQLKKVKSPKS